MGIQNLLKNLKSITKQRQHISRYSGEIAAVDALCWLHQAMSTCGKDICNGVTTTKYVDYCMNLVNLLLQNGVIPVLVFDGQDVPIKQKENESRRKERKENLQKARELEKAGCYQEAARFYANAIDITPSFYIPLIQELIKHHINYIIAPYEADTQLAFLAINHLVDLVITQDSDSLVYGCPKILFKMDATGYGDEICYSSIFHTPDLPLHQFTPDMFVYLCVLSGCDYLKNPPQMGMKRLCPYVEKGKTPDRILQLLQLEGGIAISQEYRNDFKRAIHAFHHQVVFDPVSRTQCCLTPATASMLNEESCYLGVIEEDQEKAVKLASLQLHPFTREETEIVIPDNYSLWRFVNPEENKKKVKPSLLSYFQVKSVSSSTVPKKQQEKKETMERKIVKGGLSRYFPPPSEEKPKLDLDMYKYKGLVVCLNSEKEKNH